MAEQEPATSSSAGATAAQDEVLIGKGALVAAAADIRGRVSIGERCVLQPGCRVVGPVSLGPGCVLEERAELLGGGEVLEVGQGNVFEVGCSVCACKRI